MFNGALKSCSMGLQDWYYGFDAKPSRDDIDLISVLLQPVVPMMVGQAGFGMQHVFANFPDFDEPDEAPEAEKPWRLLVLEDTGALLSADARERAGQGLSRFLNVVDGLIGQGLRVLVS